MKLRPKYDEYELPPCAAVVGVIVKFPSPDPRIAPKAYPLVPISAAQMRANLKQAKDLQEPPKDPIYYAPDFHEDPTYFTVYPMPSREGEMEVTIRPRTKVI